MKKIYISIAFALSFLYMGIPSYAQMEFVENKGQWDSKVNYRSDFGNGSIFLENNGFTVVLNHPDDVEVLSQHGHSINHKKNQADKLIDIQNKGVRSHAYNVSFLGGSPVSEIIAEKPGQGVYNYAIGNDPSKWAAGCKIFQNLTYKNVYPNIDIRYYADGDFLKYDFIIHPGGNPESILMKYKGADKLRIQNKELIIETSVSNTKELYPYTYQLVDGLKKEIDCKYVIEDDVVRFKVKNFKPEETIIIDPSLIFSSFTGSRADNWGYTATPGPGGSFFAGGIAFSSGYPTTIGPGYNGGKYDIAIFQFSADGRNRIYATYLGGGGVEQPHSLIATPDGSLIIGGRTNSTNFPVTLTDAAQTGPGGGYDIIVTKLNPGGSLNASVRIGGTGDDGVNINEKGVGNPSSTVATDVLRRNYGDDARSEINIDVQGFIYLASSTKSDNSKSYPLRNAFQTTFGGGRQDGVIIKFTPNLSSVLFNTYFGGSGDDACFVLAFDPLNPNLYIAGGTSSRDLPGNTTGVLYPTYQGGETDGYIISIPNTGTGIIRTSYQGTSGADIIYGIQFDKKGFPYIMGTTTGTWPVLNAPFSNVNAKQFIAKLQPDLSSYIYSTVFGRNNSPDPNISPVAFLVDRCENVYVSGWGGILNTNSGYRSSGTSGMANVNPISGLFPPDNSDFYFFVLERNAQSQLFGSHFGQNGGIIANDHVDGGTSRFDANGIIYQGMCANCYREAPFKTTPGVWATLNGSRNCNQAAVKIEMNFAGVGASIRASVDGVIDTAGCIPFKVVFTDTLGLGKTYEWDFGDGSPIVTTVAPTNFVEHTYNAVNTYRVRVISIDPASCNVADTAYLNIKVGDNKITPNFSYRKVGDCNSLEFEFENTTVADDPSKYTANTFSWDFGDGTPIIRSNITPNIRHTFPAAGPYNVRLIVDDQAFCNAVISKDSLLRISANVKAKFSTPAIGCNPYTAVFKNESLGGVTFIWEFGDTQTSTDASPTVTHVYGGIGTYNVRLIAFDDNTCNKVDTSAYFTITVVDKPTAGFDWSPQPPVANTPTQFTNLSTGAIRYLWNFGDGESSTQTSPTHLYNATDDYEVELIAYNSFGCTDTFPLIIRALIDPLLDVPNAFTPGKFGINSVISVVGFGIAKMNWKIYNRWGQVVFETADRNQGWDGTFKGALQPMDVYAYTLDVEFSDGKKLRKTGDINLLR